MPPVSAAYPPAAIPKFLILLGLSVSVYGVDLGLDYMVFFVFVFWFVYTFEVIYIAIAVFILFFLFDMSAVLSIDQINEPHLKMVPAFILGVFLAPIRGPVWRFIMLIREDKKD